MKNLMTVAFLLLATSLQAGELQYVEGEELVKLCRADNYNCIAPASDINALRASLLRNSEGYEKQLIEQQTEENLLAKKTEAETLSLSNLKLSKASALVLKSAQAAMTKRVAGLASDQARQSEELKTKLTKISEVLGEMSEFSENYFINLATITSPEVRESYVYSSHREYHYFVNQLSKVIKASKEGVVGLLEKNCKYRINLSSFENEGYCGDYSINPYTNFEGMKFMIFDKVGSKSLPLKFKMIKKNRRSDAVYSKKSHTLNVYYYHYSSWSWYGDSGTYSASRSEVNTAVGFELLK